MKWVFVGVGIAVVLFLVGIIFAVLVVETGRFLDY